jgi:hypothetical protein
MNGAEKRCGVIYIISALLVLPILCGVGAVILEMGLVAYEDMIYTWRENNGDF